VRAEALKKTGPSGIGKEHYTWFLRNVLLVPLLPVAVFARYFQRETARPWRSEAPFERRCRLPII
jgi:hypothetical protein